MRIIDADDFEAVSPVFKGKKGQRFAEFLIRILSIEKVNQVYDHSGNYTGSEFTTGLLKDLGVNYIIGNAERLRRIPEGAFITVSNHPYGGLDGVILIDLMAGIRRDYKLMVNKTLSLIKTLKENFISVIPLSNDSKGVSAASITGIRETLTRLHEGHPVGFFPSGAVSDFKLKELKLRDREWQKSILSLIHAAKVPVLPIRFFDRNSPFFYFLGMVNWKIRLLRLPHELFNKREQNPRIGIGSIISVEEMEQFTDVSDLGTFLRKTVYEMPVPSSFIPRSMLNIRN